MITKIELSPLKNKRYRVTMDDGEHYDFGFKDPVTGRFGDTFVDNHSLTKRENYRNRHLGNKIEKILISNLIPSPSVFSYWILWGPYTSIKKNIEFLNNEWKEKYLAKK